MTKAGKYCLGLFFLLLGACKMLPESAMSPVEFLGWMKTHNADFVHEKDIDKFKFTWVVIPSGYKILSEVENVESITKDYYSMRDSALKDVLCCNLVISPVSDQQTLLEEGLEDQREYGGRLNYFLNHAQKDIYLLQGTDTLPCLSYHFENTYGLQKHNTLDLMFKKPNNDKGDVEFVFEDQSLNIGTIRFTQDIKKLKTIPHIKLN